MNAVEEGIEAIRKCNRLLGLLEWVMIDMNIPDYRTGQVRREKVWLDLYNDSPEGKTIATMGEFGILFFPN